MNSKVRSFLINLARTKDKFVFYSDLVKECELGFDLSTPKGLHMLRTTLGEVSIYENQFGRPLISALAIYKDPKRNDQGEGFYKLAEILGKGKAKTLRENLYGFEEAQLSRDFWQDEANYKSFAGTDDTSSKYKEEFFTKEELEFFHKWHLKPYEKNNKEHYDAKEYIMNTVWEKSIFLCNQIKAQMPGFEIEGKKVWSQRGRKFVDGKNVAAAAFKPYTWVKVFKNTDRGRDIYFTFGIDAVSEAFLYKIDCRDARDSKLTKEQIDLCKSLIPSEAKWNEIPYDALLQMDWTSLTAICVQFVGDWLVYYDAIIEAVWGKPISPVFFKNTLIKRNKPTDGNIEFPVKNRRFEGVDVDFTAKAREQKDLGDKGEKLVKQHEIDYLKENEMFDEANKVDIVKDGMGYDVISYDLEGNERYIEVKTTTGNQYAGFYLSENEFEFMQQNVGRYCIYRVYNYDEENNFGEFFEVANNVQSQLLMKPTNYLVILKAER